MISNLAFEERHIIKFYTLYKEDLRQKVKGHTNALNYTTDIPGLCELVIYGNEVSFQPEELKLFDRLSSSIYDFCNEISTFYVRRDPELEIQNFAKIHLESLKVMLRQYKELQALGAVDKSIIIDKQQDTTLYCIQTIEKKLYNQLTAFNKLYLPNYSKKFLAQLSPLGLTQSYAEEIGIRK
jgi:hypothetical protein